MYAIHIDFYICIYCQWQTTHIKNITFENLKFIVSNYLFVCLKIRCFLKKNL